MVYVQICKGLFRLIEKSISLVYDIVCQRHLQSFGSPLRSGADNMETTSSPISSPFIDLLKELFQMLAIVGPHLYRDTLLLQKVCRVLRGYYLSDLEFVANADGALNGETIAVDIKILFFI